MNPSPRFVNDISYPIEGWQLFYDKLATTSRNRKATAWLVSTRYLCIVLLLFHLDQCFRPSPEEIEESLDLFTQLSRDRVLLPFIPEERSVKQDIRVISG
jgi:hypothetical protein